MYKLVCEYPNNQHLSMPNLTFIQCLRYIRDHHVPLRFKVYCLGKLAWEFGDDGIYVVPRFTNSVFR